MSNIELAKEEFEILLDLIEAVDHVDDFSVTVSRRADSATYVVDSSSWRLVFQYVDGLLTLTCTGAPFLINKISAEKAIIKGISNLTKTTTTNTLIT